jgi:hypothetical protein
MQNESHSEKVQCQPDTPQASGNSSPDEIKQSLDPQSNAIQNVVSAGSGNDKKRSRHDVWYEFEGGVCFFGVRAATEEEARARIEAIKTTAILNNGSITIGSHIVANLHVFSSAPSAVFSWDSIAMQRSLVTSRDWLAIQLR